MDNQLLTGKLIRLVGAGPDEMGKLTQEWTKDSEFFLFFDSDPVLPRNAAKAAEFFREHVLRDRPGAFLLR